MRLVGTVATIASEPRTVMTGTKKDHPKVIQTLTIIDEDGGIVTLQEWSEPGAVTEPFKGLTVGTRIATKISGPSVYQGQTRASVAEPIKRL